jgi:hypothetical protein
MRFAFVFLREVPGQVLAVGVVQHFDEAGDE